MSTPLLFGCMATGGQFKPEAIKPGANGAVLYVYRPHTLIGIGNADVPIIHLDGQRLTRIRIGGYLNAPLSAGKHKLTTTESLLGSDTGKVRGETAFSVRADSTLYLRYTESFKTIAPIVLPAGVAVVSSGDYRFEYVPEAEALAELADTKPLELDQRNQCASVLRSTVEHPSETLKFWMGSAHFLMKKLHNVKTEMSLHVLSYNMKRVMKILGVPGLPQVMQA